MCVNQMQYIFNCKPLSRYDVTVFFQMWLKNVVQSSTKWACTGPSSILKSTTYQTISTTGAFLFLQVMASARFMKEVVDKGRPLCRSVDGRPKEYYYPGFKPSKYCMVPLKTNITRVYYEDFTWWVLLPLPRLKPCICGMAARFKISFVALNQARI